MSPARLLAMLSPATVDPAKMSMGGSPTVTASDVAQALAGLSPHIVAAARYRWALDDSIETFRVLYAALMTQASQLAVEEGWPMLILRCDGQRLPYFDPLVRMALHEEHHSHLFRTHVLWPGYMRVNDRVWVRVLSKKYEAVRCCLDEWNQDAWQHLKRRTRAIA